MGLFDQWLAKAASLISSQESKVAQAINDIAQLKEKVDEMADPTVPDSHAGMTTEEAIQFAALKQDVGMLQGQVTAFTSTAATLNGSIQELKDALRSLQSTAEEIGVVANQAKRDSEALVGDVAQLKTDVAEIKTAQVDVNNLPPLPGQG